MADEVNGEPVDSNEAPSDELADTPRAASRRRSIAAIVLGVAAVVLLHGAVIGIWTIRTALDSDRFENQIEEIVRSEEVSGALAAFVLDELTAGVDLRTPLVEITPDSLDPVIDVLLAGVEARLQGQVTELIQRPEVASTVAEIAGRAHALAVDVLEGESVSDRLNVDGDAVRINLVPLVARALGLLPDLGLFADVEVPQFEPGGDPAAQVAELEAAFDVELADDFAQPVIFRSDTLEELGTTVDLARSLLFFARAGLWVLLIVGAAFAVLSIRLATRRLRAAVVLVGGVVALSLLTRAITGTLASRVPDAVEDPGARATVGEIVLGLQRDLSTTLIWYSLLALLALGVASSAIYRWPPTLWARLQPRTVASAEDN